MQKKRLIPILTAAISLLLFSLTAAACQKKNCSSFEVSSDSDFYITAKNRIIGYRLENGQPVKTAESEAEVYRGNLNPSVERAELQDRYLIFTDDDWPTSRNEGIVSVDFQEGIIRFLKTHHTAYTSAGEAENYYFAATSGGESSLSAYKPDLQEVDRIDIHPNMILSNFQSDSLPFWLTGTDVDASENESQVPFFKDRLVKGDIRDGQLCLEAVGELETNSDCQFWFSDSLYRNGILYAISPGYRVHETKERVYSSAMYRYDPETGTGSFFPLETPGLTQIYNSGEDWVVLTVTPGESGPLNMTLFNLSTDENYCIDLPELQSEEENEEPESIMDVKFLRDSMLLILTNKQLLGYDLQAGQIVFRTDLSEETESPFHLWINQENLET